MITSMNASQQVNAPGNLIFNKTTPAAQSDSFVKELISQLQGFIDESGNGSHFQIDVQTEPGQNPDSRQFLVTVKNTAATIPATTAPAIVVAPPAATIPAATIPTTTAPPTAKSKMSPTDCYWAEQPPELQAIRFMPEDEKGDAINDLAKKGFAIDVPIMLWGWDPLVVMTARQTAGYTWVPSAMQTAVAVGPGLNFPGLPSYDPQNPPPGSIKVSTDFAIGSANNDPWIKV